MRRHPGARHNSYSRSVRPPAYNANNLANLGLAVRREIDPRQLDGVMDTFRELRSLATTSFIRGEGDQPAASFFQLEKNEPRRQLPLRNVDVQEAKNEIYESVDTLRRPLYVKLGQVVIIGRKSPIKNIALSFEPCDATVVHEERADVINTLEGLADEVYTHEDFNWNRRGTPCLSIGKIPTNTPREHQAQIIQAVAQAAPDGLYFQRATII